MIPILFWSQFTIDVRLHGTHTDLGLYQHSLTSQRSILEHVSICSPSQFVHLHEKPYRLFFEPELDEKRTDFCITHGRKTISPSRNPCDFDPSWSQLTIDVRLHGTHTDLFIFRAGARTEPHQLGQISWSFFLPTAERRLTADRSIQICFVRAIAYEKASSLLSIGSLEQFWNAITLELRASLLAGGLHFRFFNVCLVLHGLY